MIGMLLAAALLAPQSLDTADEAWTVAVRNGITPAEWRMVSSDPQAAYFVKKGSSTQRWTAAVDAADLTVTLMLLNATCSGTSNRFYFAQTSTRDWRGGYLTESGPTEPQYAAPGSVGEMMVEAICKPPPVTLPIAPSR